MLLSYGCSHCVLWQTFFFLKKITLKFLLKSSDRLLEIDDVNKMEPCYTLSSITLDWMSRKLFQSWMFLLIHSYLENRPQSWSILFSILFYSHDIKRGDLDLCLLCHMCDLLSGSVLLFAISVLFWSTLIREAEMAILTYFGRTKCVQCVPEWFVTHAMPYKYTLFLLCVFSSSGCHSKIYFSPFWRVRNKGEGTSVARLWWGLSS